MRSEPWIQVDFEMSIERFNEEGDAESLELCVSALVEPVVEAVLDRAPEDCYEAEGGDVEIVSLSEKVVTGKATSAIKLSDEELDRLVTAANVEAERISADDYLPF